MDGERSPCALLVSVRNAREARLAIDGGCDILDVKEPTRGSLGMADGVEIAGILAVRDEFAPTIPMSVALGEAVDWEAAGGNIDDRGIFHDTGVGYFKLGTAGLGSASPGSAGQGAGGDWRERFQRARLRCQNGMPPPSSTTACQWVAVAYADWNVAAGPAPAEVIRGAAACGCSGLLIDTFTKSAGGLFHWTTASELRSLAGLARDCGLWFALAGRLAIADLPALRSIAPDIVGIRSAACRGQRRNGEIDPAAVRMFRRLLSDEVPTRTG